MIRKIEMLHVIDPGTADEKLTEHLMGVIKSVNVYKAVISLLLFVPTGVSFIVLFMQTSGPLLFSHKIYYINAIPLLSHMFYIMASYPGLQNYRKLIVNN